MACDTIYKLGKNHNKHEELANLYNIMEYLSMKSLKVLFQRHDILKSD